MYTSNNRRQSVKPRPPIQKRHRRSRRSNRGMVLVSIPASRGQRWTPETHLKACTPRYSFYSSAESVSTQSTDSSSSSSSGEHTVKHRGGYKIAPNGIILKGRGEVPFVHTKSKPTKIEGSVSHRGGTVPPQTIVITDRALLNRLSHHDRKQQQKKQGKVQCTVSKSSSNADDVWNSKNHSKTYSGWTWVPNEFKAWSAPPPNQTFDVVNGAPHYWMPEGATKVLPRIIADCFHERRRRAGTCWGDN